MSELEYLLHFLLDDYLCRCNCAISTKQLSYLHEGSDPLVGPFEI